MRIASCVLGSPFAPQARSKKEHACPPPTNDPSANANDSPPAHDLEPTQENAPMRPATHHKNS